MYLDVRLFWLIIQTDAKHSEWEEVEIMGAPTYTVPINNMTSNQSKS